MSREAMEIALEALEFEASGWEDVPPITRDAITALRQALEETQEPVGHEPGPTAWQCQCGKPYTLTCISSKPPKKEWVGLTPYEIQEIHSGNQHWGNFACAIEAKLKEKNHFGVEE